MEKSIFNKKKWIKSHLDEILTMKKDGLTNKAIIQSLIDDKNMPFDLSESLLSRYLKDFCVIEPSVSKENEKLTRKNLRQIDRISEQNNEIQNLKRRLERVIERNMYFETENEVLKERNRILENKFLDGEARLKDLRRYNGYNNVHWKVSDLEQKNDDMLHRMISLERHCEKIAEPLEQLDEQIRQVTIERDAVTHELGLVNTKLEKEQEKLLDVIQKLDYATEVGREREQELIAIRTKLEKLQMQSEQSIQPEISKELVLIRTKFKQEKERNQDLIEKNYDLNMAVKRFKDNIAVLRMEVLDEQEKAKIQQNRVNQVMIWRYVLFVVVVVLLLVIIVLMMP